MKKIILSAFLLVSGFALFAQNNVAQNNSSVPNNIRLSFENTYQGATNVTWESVKLPVFSKYTAASFANVTWDAPMDGWRASYVINNRLMHVYYTPAGKNYTVALPAMENKVPEEVITKAISMYGNNIYDITEMKNAMNTEVYHVRISGNDNNITSVWINADGSTASDIYVTR